MDNSIKPYCKKIFTAGLFIYIITAYFSEGYHHPDEHFQVLEFCNYKLGNISAEQLPWEFKDQIRPGLIVFCAFAVIKFLQFLHISNPFVIAFILRLLVAVSVWYVTKKLCLALIDNFKTEKGKKLFIAMSMLLWFVPYTSVRFSSENFAGVSFLFAVYLLLQLQQFSSQRKTAALIGAGLLLGFSFFFRFQMGFAIAGLGLWLLFINKMQWKQLLLLSAAGIASGLLCVCADYWLYGNWVFSPLNYFTANITEGVAANWGVYPWWYYFYLFIIQAIPPVSIVLLLFFFTGIYKKRADIFTWCIIPFLLAHFVTGHKEMRFLFPVIFAFIYLAAVGIDIFFNTGKYVKLIKPVFIFCIVINIPLLLAKMFTPAQEAVDCYKFLYSYAGKKNITLYCPEKNVYEVVGLPVSFYKSPDVKTVVLKNEEEFYNYLSNKQPDTAYFFNENLTADTTITGYKKEIIYSLFPKWVLRYNYGNWQSRTRIWSINEFTKNNAQ